MKISKTTRSTIGALMGTASLLIVALSNQALAEEPQNPAVAMTNAAMVATGACVSKYVGRLDSGAREPAAVAKQVAERCQHEIARSVGLATMMSGRPDDYAKNLEYINAVYTTNAVVRSRAAGSKRQI